MFDNDNGGEHMRLVTKMKMEERIGEINRRGGEGM